MDISGIDETTPVLIAGPTASGKSSLAMEIAHDKGGVILNADAIQVFDGWRVLTARPSKEDEASAPHALYGHIAFDATYSVGDWLRDLAPFLQGDARPIIVGGTGLYFTALTQGLAEIPEIDAEIRKQADALRLSGRMSDMIAQLDAATRERLDLNNPMRVQRAWEVLRATGKGLREWQAATPPPLLPLEQTFPIVLQPEPDWLNERIARRFDQMLETGALEEMQANMSRYDSGLLSCKAIGAPELHAYALGETTLEEARNAATIATRQFAKRQRTWFRSKMKDWHAFALP